MSGWRTKFIFLLIVYFAGFATAIYCLVPVPEDADSQACEKTFMHSALKSDELAQSFSVKMHTCLDFAQKAAGHTGSFIKQKLDQRKTDG